MRKLSPSSACEISEFFSEAELDVMTRSSVDILRGFKPARVITERMVIYTGIFVGPNCSLKDPLNLIIGVA